VTHESDALDLKHGVFTLRDPKRIRGVAETLAERSSRRKAGAYRSGALDADLLYQPGRQDLAKTQRDRLERAKDELKRVFQSQLMRLSRGRRNGFQISKTTRHRERTIHSPPPPAKRRGGRGAHRARLRDPRRMLFARGIRLISRPLRIEGAGNAGRPMRPIAACAKVVSKMHTR